jgi:hypothetical protein
MDPNPVDDSDNSCICGGPILPSGPCRLFKQLLSYRGDLYELRFSNGNLISDIITNFVPHSFTHERSDFDTHSTTDVQANTCTLASTNVQANTCTYHFEADYQQTYYKADYC